MQPMVEFALRALRGAQDQYYRIREKIDVAREDRILDALLEDTARHAEQQIVHRFSRGYPQHGISGRYTPYREGENDGKDYHWKIELQHGYANLAAGCPGWAISMVCLYKGRPEHVVLISPFTDEEFIASRGRGMQFNQRRIRASNATQLPGARVALGLPERWMRTRHLSAYQALTQSLAPHVDVLRATGCSLMDVAELAAGRVDIAFAFGLDEHDLNVASLLMKEAGALLGPPNGSPMIEPEAILMATSQRLYRTLVKQLSPLVS